MKTEQKQSKWTDWTEILVEMDDGIKTNVMYKTNHKKVRVKLPEDNIMAESCCSKYDEFDEVFGVRMAFLRCLVKAWKKDKSVHEDTIKCIDKEIATIETDIKEMIDSLCD